MTKNLSGGLSREILQEKWFPASTFKKSGSKIVLLLVFALMSLGNVSFGQAANASWTLTSSTTPSVTGNITAATPSFGSGLSNTGSNGTYGIYANNWPTSATTPAPSSGTKYFQFSVTPTASNSLTITSLSLGYYNNEGFLPDGLAIFYSTSATFATSTQVIANSTQINSNSGTYTNSSISATAASGQTLYFRVYYYNASFTSVYFGARTLSLSGTTASSNTITTSAITGSPFCVTASAGAAVSVPFTSTGTFTSNTYTAQLSNAAGSFTTPTTIGTSGSNLNSGTISATIPANTATGTGYRIRVISNNPAVNGSDNGTNLTINLAVNSIAPTATQNINVGVNGTALTGTEQSAATSRTWYYGTTSGGPYSTSTGITAASYTPNFSSQGTYYVVCISTFSCGNVTSNQVQINVSATIATSAISGSPFCVTASSGASVSVPFTSAGTFSSNTYTAQLSNASGSFSSPTAIGTLVSNANSGTINATIPANMATGTGYRIRVISNSPVVNGSDNGSNLTINLAANSIAPTASQNINVGVNGTALIVTEQSTATSRTWYYGTTSGGPYSTSTGITSASYTPNFSSQGTYYVVCISNFSCGSVTSNQVQVNVSATVTTGTISGLPICVNSISGASVSVPFTSAGTFSSNTYTAQLSNASGSFGSPTVIGTLVSNTNLGTISATLPASTATGTGYIVRVIATNPSVTGSNSNSFTLNTSPVTTGATICQGSTGTLSSTSSCATLTNVNAGPIYAGTGANVTGVGAYAWSGTSSIGANDNVYATVTPPDNGDASNYLRGTNYSLAIPSTATINGIQVTIGRYSDNFIGIDLLYDNIVKLVKAGTVIGNNKASGSAWSTSETAITYGSSSDLWGTTWTPSDINNANFGAVLSVINNTIIGISYTAHVDYIQVTVTYSIAGSTNWYTVSSGGTSIGSGTPFNPVGVSGSGLSNTNTPGTTTYYAECSSVPGCRTATDFKINAAPVAPVSGGNQTVCSDGTATQTLTATATGGIITWYNAATGGSIVSSPTQVGVGTVTYYAQSFNGTCSSVTRTAVKLTINVVPPAPVSGGNQTVCSDGTTTQTLTATATGGTITWYNAATGGTIVPSPTQVGVGTVTYYAQSSNGTCSSLSRTVVTLTINPAPSATISYSGSPYCGSGSASVTQTGTTGGTYSSATGLSINASTGAVDLSASTPATYLVTYTISASGGCSIYATTASISITSPGTWLGVTSDWNNASNWCGGIPDASTNIIIPVVSSGIYPSASSAAAMANNITIASGASVIVNAYTLQITGSIINNGTFNAGNGMVELNSSSAQTIPANTFFNHAIKDLVISNSSASGVTLNDSLDVYNSLTYGALGTNFNTNNNLTLKSTMNNTAYIGDMTGHTINGNVTVERYIATGTSSAANHGKSWQLLATPTQGQTMKQSWQEGASATNISSPAAGSAGNPVSGYGTMLTSNVANAATQATPGFDAYTSSGASIKVYNHSTGSYDGALNTSAQLYNQKGYFVFVRGDRSVYTSSGTATPTVLRSKGSLFTPSNLPPVTSIVANAFESVGNPYAAPLDMRNINRTGGVTEFFQVWDPRAGGSYNYGAFQTFSFDGTNYVVTPGGGSYGAGGSVNNYIQSGQAFFMQTSGSSGTVSFTEASKAIGTVTFATPFTRQGSDQVSSITSNGRTASGQTLSSMLRTTLHSVNADGSTGSIVDGVLNQFGDTYSNDVDNLDAKKSMNTGENLSIKTFGKLLIIEKKHTISNDDTIYLNITSERAQQYQLSFDAQNLNTIAEGFIEDSYTNTRTPLNLNGNTIVNFTVANITGSYAADRFRIVFSPLKVLPVTFTSIKAYKQDASINVEWKVANEINIRQYEVEKSTDGSVFTTIAVTKPTANNSSAATYIVADTKPVTGNNYYRVRSIDINGAISYSTIVKVAIGNLNKDIKIYPNPITDGEIHLQFTNESQGKYRVRLINKTGQVILKKELDRTEGSGTEFIKWDFNLAHGMYQLEVTRPDGSVKDINVMY